MTEKESASGTAHLVPSEKCTVHIIMGSKSDLPVARKAIGILEELELDYGISVASAHRTPDLVEDAVKRSGASVFIAIAGLSAALPGVVASHTRKPVIGVPVSGKVPFDSLLSIVQMPPGVPVGSVGVDRGDNAALLAARILALNDDACLSALDRYTIRMREKVLASAEEVIGDI